MMTEAECQLLFNGFVSENDETLKRFKAACIVDLELSVEDATAIINHERSIIRVGSRIELEPLKDLLTRLGANVSLQGPGETPHAASDATHANDEEKAPDESSEDTLVFEFDELEISGPPTPPKPKEPKAYVLDIGEENEEPVEDVVAKPEQPGTSLDFQEPAHDDDDLDFLATTVELNAPKLEMTPPPSSATDRVPKPIIPKAPMESLELTLGPEPVEMKAAEPVHEEKEEQFDISVPEEEPKKNEELHFSVAEETPAPPVKKSAPVPPAEPPPVIKAPVEEPKTEIPVQAKPESEKTPEAPLQTEKKTIPAQKNDVPAEEPEEQEPAKPKKKKKLRNLSFDTDFSFSRNQVIGLFLVGLIFLAGTNLLLSPDPSLDAPELNVPQLPPEPEKKADERKNVNPAPKQPQWSGAVKNENYALFISLNEGAKSSLLLKISGSTTEPPPLTPEEIVKKVQPRPWLRRIDGEPLALVSESPTKLSGSGTVFGFIEHGQIRKRIPLNVLAQLEMNEDRTSAATQVVISYLSNDETTLPAKGRVIESAPQDSYRVALEAELELTQK